MGIHQKTNGADENLKIKELHIYTHSGRGQIYLLDSNIDNYEIIKLDKLNWYRAGNLVCYGCNSGRCNPGSKSVAESFSEGQEVQAVGQDGESSFSENRNQRYFWTTISDNSEAVYLWTYGKIDGIPYGETRKPVVFPQKKK